MYNSHKPLAFSIDDMPKLAKAFIQIYLCLVVALFLWNSIKSVSFPYGIDYGEAPLMDQAQRVMNKDILYKSNIDEPPFVIANYPPIFPTLIGIMHSLFRLPLFQAGRLTSIFFSIIGGYIVGLFSYRLTQNKWLAIFSTAVFWGQPYVIYWSSLARVDLMALTFSLLGLWAIYRYQDTILAISIATLCFLISVYTRQTYILAGPLAALIWLWHLNRKRAVLFITLFTFSGLFIFGMINALTQGGFYSNIIVSNMNQFNLLHVFNSSTRLFFLWPFFVAISLATLLLTIYTKLKKPADDRFMILQQPFLFHGLVFYTLGASLSALTIGKIGSNVNYFLELIAACSIWIVITWKLVLNKRSSIQWTFFALLIFQSIWILTNSYGLIHQNIQAFTEKRNTADSLEKSIGLAKQNGIVLSDDYMDLIVISGQPIYYQPFEYGELYEAGLWNPTQFVNQIEQHEFPLIIIGGDKLDKDCCWPPPAQLALQSNYQIEHYKNVLILTPLK